MLRCPAVPHQSCPDVSKCHNVQSINSCPDVSPRPNAPSTNSCRAAPSHFPSSLRGGEPPAFRTFQILIYGVLTESIFYRINPFTLIHWSSITYLLFLKWTYLKYQKIKYVSTNQSSQTNRHNNKYISKPWRLQPNILHLKNKADKICGLIWLKLT